MAIKFTNEDLLGEKAFQIKKLTLTKAPTLSIAKSAVINPSSPLKTPELKPFVAKSAVVNNLFGQSVVSAPLPVVKQPQVQALPSASNGFQLPKSTTPDTSLRWNPESLLDTGVLAFKKLGNDAKNLPYTMMGIANKLVGAVMPSIDKKLLDQATQPIQDYGNAQLKKDTYMKDETAKFQLKYKNADLSANQKLLNDVVGGSIDMLPMIATNVATGGMGIVSSAPGLGTMFVKVFSNSYQNALQDGANEDDAYTYGVLNGALEVATEKMSGGVPGMGEGVATKGIKNWLLGGTNNMLEGTLGKFAKTETSKQFLAKAVDVFGEGFEEYVSAIFEDALTKTYKETPGSLLGNIGKKMASQDAFYQALVGSVTSGFMELSNYSLAKTAEATILNNPISNMSQEEQRTVATRLAESTGNKIIFDADLPEGENGRYNTDTRTIEISKYTANPVIEVAKHEVTHSLEEADGFQEVQDFVLSTVSNYQKIFDAKQKAYEQKTGEKQTDDYINKEIFAEVVETALFKDADSVIKLAKMNLPVMTKVRDAIRKVVSVLGNNSEERYYVDQIEQMFTHVLNGVQVSKMNQSQVKMELDSKTQVASENAQNVANTIVTPTPGSKVVPFNKPQKVEVANEIPATVQSRTIADAIVKPVDKGGKQVKVDSKQRSDATKRSDTKNKKFMLTKEQVNNINIQFDRTKIKNIDKLEMVAKDQPDGIIVGKDGIYVNVERNQKPVQSGKKTASSSVYYLGINNGTLSEDYKGDDSEIRYGGSEWHQGTIVLRNPVIVEGETGGDVPMMAMNEVMGDKEYEKFFVDYKEVYDDLERMTIDVEDATADVFGLIKKYTKLSDEDIQAYTDNIININTEYSDIYILGTYIDVGRVNTMMRELIASETIKEQGFDSIVGFKNLNILIREQIAYWKNEIKLKTDDLKRLGYKWDETDKKGFSLGFVMSSKEAKADLWADIYYRDLREAQRYLAEFEQRDIYNKGMISEVIDLREVTYPSKEKPSEVDRRMLKIQADVRYMLTKEQTDNLDIEYNFERMRSNKVLKHLIKVNKDYLKVTDSGVEVKVYRYQKPEQSGKRTVRGSVFYMGSSVDILDQNFYNDENSRYGGSEEHNGKILFKNPLIISGETGGYIPSSIIEKELSKSDFNNYETYISNIRNMDTNDIDYLMEEVSFMIEYYGKLSKSESNKQAKNIIDVYTNNESDIKYDTHYISIALNEFISSEIAKNKGYDGVIGYSFGSDLSSDIDFDSIKKMQDEIKSISKEVKLSGYSINDMGKLNDKMFKDRENNIFDKKDRETMNLIGKVEDLKVYIRELKEEYDSSYITEVIDLREVTYPSKDKLSEVDKRFIKDSMVKDEQFHAGFDVKYSIKSGEHPELIAIHNLDEDKLYDQLKDFNAIPVPSIAIIKSGMEHDDYGYISLVMKPDVVDPAKSPVFSADAYTPTYPAIFQKVNLTKYREDIKKFEGGIFDGKISMYDMDKTTLERQVRRVSFEASTKENYLKEKGINYEIVKKPYISDKYELTPKFMDKFIEENPKIKELNVFDYGYSDISNEYKENVINLLENQWEKRMVKYYLDKRIGKISRADIYEVLSEVKEYIDAKNKEYIIDRDKTYNNIDEAIKPFEKDFKQWVEDGIKDSFSGKYILNNDVPIFDDEGNRSQFESYSMPLTLENLVKNLSGNVVANNQIFEGLGVLNAKLSTKFKSKEEMLMNKNRLVDAKTHFNQKEILEDELKKISKEFTKYSKEEANDYDGRDAIFKYVDSVGKEKISVSGLSSFVKKHGFRIPSELSKKVINYLEELSNLPATYFESKPQRAVSFDEVMYAIIPESTSQRTIDLLDQKNVKHITYSDSEKRSDIISKLEDVKFSLDSEEKVQLKKDVKQDNKGRELSKEQSSYFKDSKVVDEQGNLLTVYHGSRASDFTVFDNSIGRDRHNNLGEGLYFTSDINVAKDYVGDDSGKLYELYLNLENPLDISGDGKNVMTYKMIEDAVYSLPDSDIKEKWKLAKEDGYNYVDSNIHKAKTLDEAKKMLANGIYNWGKESGSANRGRYIGLSVITENNDHLSTIMKNMGFDGIDNGNGTYVVLDPSKIKDVANKIPTVSKDIRYSLSEDQSRLLNRIARIDIERTEKGIWVTAFDKYGSSEYISSGAVTYSKMADKFGEEVADIIMNGKDNFISKRELEKLSEKIKYIELPIEEVKKYVAKASREFGLTNDFREAGYLTVTGKLLDFSEKRNGGQRGKRSMDHRGISSIGANMDEFIQMGNIRMKPESDGFELAKVPTKEQKALLRQYISKSNGEVYVDLVKDEWNTEGIEYSEGTSTSKIFNDIESFFETGIIPKQSDINKFRYSIDNAKEDKFPDITLNMPYNKKTDNKYKNQVNTLGFTFNDKVMQDAVDLVKGKKSKGQTVRTREEWMMVANQIGINLKAKTSQELTDYAYQTWYTLHPNEKQNFNRQGKGYVDFKVLSWVDAVYKGAGVKDRVRVPLKTSQQILADSQVKKVEAKPSLLNEVEKSQLEHAKKNMDLVKNDEGSLKYYNGLVDMSNGIESEYVMRYRKLPIENKSIVLDEVELSDAQSNTVGKQFEDDKQAYDDYIKSVLASDYGDDPVENFNKVMEVVKEVVKPDDTQSQEVTILREKKIGTEAVMQQFDLPVVEQKHEKLTEDVLKVSKHEKTIANSGTISEYEANKIYKDIEKGKFTYVLNSDKEALKSAKIVYDKKGFDGSYNYLEAIITSNQRILKNDFALADLLMYEATKAHNREQTMKMYKIITDLSAIGSELGQSVQAMSLINKLTPYGKLLALNKVIDRMEKRYSDIGKVLDITVNKELESQMLGETDPDKVNDLMDMIKLDIANQMPSTWNDKLTAWRYLSMLGNPRTHIRNILGNAMFVPMKVMRDVVGSNLDLFLPKADRTHAILSTSKADTALKSFARENFKEVKEMITSGGKYDTRSEIEQMKQIFKTKWLEKVRVFSFDMLEKEDGWFLETGFVSSFAQYMKAKGLTADTITEEQLIEAQIHATNEAKKFTYRDVSALASYLTRLETESKSKLVRGAVSAVIPFKKTPINILKRGYEFSPLGMVGAITKGSYDVKNGKISPTQFIDQISAGLTGTAVAMLGALLFNMGIISSGGGDDPKRKEALDSQNGWQRYSFNFFGNTYTIDWIMPTVMPLIVGAEIQNQLSKMGGSLMNSVPNAIIAVFDPVFELSMLQGVMSTMQSFSGSGSATAGEAIATIAQNYAGQFVPTIAGQIARTIDPVRRSTTVPNDSPINPIVETFLRKMANKIPLASMLNEPVINQRGEVAKQPDNIVVRAFLNALSPGYYSEGNVTTQDKEILRLYESTKDMDSIPKVVATTVTNESKTYILSSKEKTAFAKTMGTESYKEVADLLKSSAYKSLKDADKVAVVKSVYDYAQTKAKADMMKTRNVKFSDSTYTKIEDAKKISISPSEYLTVKNAYSSMKESPFQTKKELFTSYMKKSGYSSSQIEYMLVNIGGYAKQKTFTLK